MSPAVVLAQIRAANAAALNVDLRGHADETRQAIYQARIALYRAEDILAARAGETLTRGNHMIQLLQPSPSPKVGTASTPRDLVRMHAPDATDDDCDFLLWECSSFPFGSIGDWFGQVREAIAQVPRG